MDVSPEDQGSLSVNGEEPGSEYRTGQVGGRRMNRVRGTGREYYLSRNVRVTGKIK